MSGIREELKNAGLKITGPRVQVLEHLESAKDRHLSAEEIWTALREKGQTRHWRRFIGVDAVRGRRFGSAAQLRGNTAVFELADEEHQTTWSAPSAVE